MHRKLARLEELVLGGFSIDDISSDDRGIHVILTDPLMRLTMTFTRQDAAEILGAPTAQGCLR